MSVLVVFGGSGWEREGSILSASEVARSLDRIGVSNVMIEHHDGLFDKKSLRFDVVFNCVHGKHGEDGTLSKKCEILNLFYTFSPKEAHELAYNKLSFKDFCNRNNVDVPELIRSEDDTFQQNVHIPQSNWELIIKPVFGGGSRGIKHVRNLSELDRSWVDRELSYEPYFVERFVPGNFISCAISGNETLDRSLPLLQVSHDGKVYDYEIKHAAESRQYILPAALTADQEACIRNWASMCYNKMKGRSFIRFDFIVSETLNRIVTLEANTVPGLSKQGNLAAIWQGSGRKYDDMIDFILKSAR